MSNNWYNPFNSGRYAPRRPRFSKQEIMRQWRMGGPVITVSIILLCVVLYVVEVLLSWVYPPAYAMLIADGAAFPAYMLIRPWTAVTSLFLHSTSIFHVLFNMISLWIVGPSLEKMMGHIHYLFLYLIAGIGGSLGIVVWAVSAPSQGWSLMVYGASGAIFGLFAAMLVVYHRIGSSRQLFSMIIWMVINFMMAIFIPGIAWQAHVGGFLIGGLLAWLLTMRSSKMRKLTMNVRMAIFGGALFVVCTGLMLWLASMSPAYIS